MNEYYPYGLFCDWYGCWCNDVTELTENQNECNGNCKECQHSSKPKKK